MLKLLSPLLAHLTFVGKARELLAVLESPSDPTTSVCEDHMYTDCGEYVISYTGLNTQVYSCVYEISVEKNMSVPSYSLELLIHISFYNILFYKSQVVISN